MVFHEGDPGDALHIVESGLFVARSSSTLGHVLTVNVFRAVCVFGSLALLSPDSCSSATRSRCGQTPLGFCTVTIWENSASAVLVGSSTSSFWLCWSNEIGH